MDGVKIAPGVQVEIQSKPIEGLSQLRPGDFVKVRALIWPKSSERFWIKVTTNENGCFQGTVDNDLVLAPIAFGAKVTVPYECVIDTLWRECRGRISDYPDHFKEKESEDKEDEF